MVLREPEAEVTLSSLYPLSPQGRTRYRALHSMRFGLKQAQDNRDFLSRAVTWLAGHPAVLLYMVRYMEQV